MCTRPALLACSSTLLRHYVFFLQNHFLLIYAIILASIQRYSKTSLDKITQSRPDFMSPFSYLLLSLKEAPYALCALIGSFHSDLYPPHSMETLVVEASSNFHLANSCGHFSNLAVLDSVSSTGPSCSLPPSGNSFYLEWITRFFLCFLPKHLQCLPILL